MLFYIYTVAFIWFYVYNITKEGWKKSIYKSLFWRRILKIELYLFVSFSFFVNLNLLSVGVCFKKGFYGGKYSTCLKSVNIDFKSKALKYGNIKR